MASDASNSSSSSFILVGFPGLEAFPTCLGVLFCSAYVLALVGNGAVLLVTGLDKSLRAPCHRLLAMLAAVDVLMVTAVVPKLLGVLWLNSAEMGYVACFVQMFLVHSATSAESGLLLAMAIDRYVAICHPLRYHSILSARAMAQMGLAIVLRALLFMVPLMGLMFPSDLTPHVQVLVADWYLTVPPTLNALVYGIKVKQIQEGTLRLLGQLAGLRLTSC
ncbi:olfactory receptor 52A5-like [Manacus vitellinus]|uniref:olfactory receptor 52A5-like n=1 Tax=Manacus vitellinus TaxID=328815 RepID=UPI00115F084C|nr:olfactory receptor 52A5-like [Manacus vitellinus]